MVGSVLSSKISPPKMYFRSLTKLLGKPMTHNVCRHNATPSTGLFYQMSEALSEHFLLSLHQMSERRLCRLLYAVAPLIDEWKKVTFHNETNSYCFLRILYAIPAATKRGRTPSPMKTMCAGRPSHSTIFMLSKNPELRACQ